MAVIATDPCYSSMSYDLHWINGEIECIGYGDNVESSWHIEGGEGERFNVRFKLFSTQPEHDYIEIYDGKVLDNTFCEVTEYVFRSYVAK